MSICSDIEDGERARKGAESEGGRKGRKEGECGREAGHGKLERFWGEGKHLRAVSCTDLQTLQKLSTFC